MLAIAVVGLVLGTRLLDQDNDDPPSRTSAASTTTRIDSEREVEDAFRAFVEMVARVDLAPDPDDPEIATRTTGATRSTFTKAVADRKANGTIVKTGPQDRQTIRSTSIKGDTATMSVCYVGQTGVYDAETGAVKQPMSTTTTPLAVTLTREDGAWKVSRVSFEGAAKKGVTECD